jgi:hypothetical protein
MALSPSIQVGSVNTGATVDPTAIIVTDNSTGSDGAITSRQILLYTVQNALLTAALPWAYPTPNPITINPLGIDIALNVVANWLNVSGTVLYTTSLIVPFTGFGEQFYYNLIQTESSSPGILQDVNYQNYKATLRNYLDSAVQSISIGQNLGNAQSMILKENYLTTNSNLFY